MIDLDKLYLKDLVVITKDYITSNAPHNDETFRRLIYLYKISYGIVFVTHRNQPNAEPITSYLTRRGISNNFFHECLDLMVDFHSIATHQIELSLLRVSDLAHSNLDLMALTPVDILALSKLPLADFKAFISASNEVKH